MTLAKLAGIKACVFDAYGTLFDFASAARGCRDVLGDNVDRVSTLWRDKQIQYTWLRAAQGRHADFWQVTGEALDFTLETLGLADAALRARLMSLYLALEPFPEVRDVLPRLKRAGLRTAILSNGSRKCLTQWSRRQSSTRRSMLFSRSSRSACSSRTRKSINSHAIN